MDAIAPIVYRPIGQKVRLTMAAKQNSKQNSVKQNKRNMPEYTTVKGSILRNEDFNREEFEIKVDYCRSADIACQRVLTALDLDPKDYTVILDAKFGKGGILNESAPRFRYNFAMILAHAVDVKDGVDEFEEIKDGFQLVSIPFYTYTAQLWCVNFGDYETPQYKTESHEFEDFQKFGKVNARNTLVTDYEVLNDGWHVIGYDAPKRTEFERIALIESETLTACRVYLADGEEDLSEELDA